MSLLELFLGRPQTAEISANDWFKAKASDIRSVLKDGKAGLFSNKSDKSIYKGRCLSEIPICHNMGNIKLPQGFIYVPVIKFRNDHRHGTVTFDGINRSHAFAVSPDEHKVLCLTFGQYASTKIRGVTYSKPGAVIEAYKRLAPGLVTVSGSGGDMVAMLYGSRDEIKDRLGLWYKVLWS